MSDNLRAGKGTRFKLDVRVLDFIQDAHDVIDRALDQYKPLVEDRKGSCEAVITYLRAKGWQYSEDKYGVAAHMEYQLDEYNWLRITVLHTTKDELKLDWRNWYDNE